MRKYENDIYELSQRPRMLKLKKIIEKELFEREKIRSFPGGCNFAAANAK